MKNHDKNIAILENVMERLELTQPVSNEVKKYIESSEKDQYKKILKRVGQLGILSSIFIGIYYFLKKFGISLIANKFISIAVISVIGTASYFSIKYSLIEMAKESEKPNEEIKILEKKVIPDKQIKLKRKNALVKIKKNKIEIRNFTSTSIDNSMLKLFNKNLIRSFKKINENRVVDITKTGKYIKHIVFGNIEDMDDGKKIYVKVIDTDTSEIIFTSIKEIDNEENLELISKTIAREILGKIK